VLGAIAYMIGTDFYQATIPFLGPMGSLASSAVLGFLRSQLRVRLGGKKGNDKLLMDMLIWYFCGCCAGIQEARTVDAHNGNGGVKVKCCCQLQVNLSPYELPLVGQTTAVVPMMPQAPLAPMVQSTVPLAPGMDPTAQRLVVQGNAHQWAMPINGLGQQVV